VLLPDVGGMLLWSKLRVVDLAGLCDVTLARTLFRDPEAARAYVFGERRPTFIHAADIWAKAASLEADPRFAADYVPIFAYDAAEDPPAAGHASGLFVRRDALALSDGEAVLARLRAEPHVRLGFLPEPSRSPVLRWLEDSRVVPAAYRAASRATVAANPLDHR
jgi:hypothetical protein